MSRKLLRTVVITEARGVKVRVGVDLFEEKILPTGADERVALETLTGEVMRTLYGPLVAKLQAIKPVDKRTQEKIEEIIHGLR